MRAVGPNGGREKGVQLVDIVQVNPLAAAGLFGAFYLIMCMLAHWLARAPLVAQTATAPGGRYGTLDGLRGLLAYGVMFTHAITAHKFFTNGVWGWSVNPVVNHLGQTTVALFFMITGFLFTRQYIGLKTDWKRLLISRFFRLTPLYVIVIVVLFFLVLSMDGFRLNVPPSQLFMQFVSWVSFACLGMPDINAMPMSWTVIAGVPWTLKYEWAFYLFGLPLVFAAHRLMGRRTFVAAALAATVAAIALAAMKGGLRGDYLYAVHFLLGIASASIWDQPAVRRIVASRTFRVLALLGMITFGLTIDNSSAAAIIATGLIFLAIVGNASIFGMLSARGAIWLGDISYGIYLWHGMILWVSLYFLRAEGVLGALNGLLFLLFLTVSGIVALAVASLLHIFIEKPMIEIGRRLSALPWGLRL